MMMMVVVIVVMMTVVVQHNVVLYLSVIWVEQGEQKYPKSNVMTALLRDALVGMGEGEGKTCKQLERVLFEDGQVVDEDL